MRTFTLVKAEQQYNERDHHITAYERCDFIAVYGTLREGYGNNRLLRNAEFVDRVRCTNLLMYSSGIPYVQLFPNSERSVVLEIWRTTNNAQMLNMDQLEGHPTWYQRTLLTMESGVRTYQAWCYLNNLPPSNTTVVKSGDYADSRRPMT